MQLRSEVNKVLENARAGKLIGSSLDAKVFLYATHGSTLAKLQKMCMASNDADSLHRIFITSQVYQTRDILA
jgi:isoleucyl-tRNA synthetase